MASVPVQALHGVYLGLPAGVIPALVAFGLGFLFRYVTDAPALAGGDYRLCTLPSEPGADRQLAGLLRCRGRAGSAGSSS